MDCKIEKGYACKTENGKTISCESGCGNGVIGEGEECDNGKDNGSM